MCPLLLQGMEFNNSIEFACEIKRSLQESTQRAEKLSFKSRKKLREWTSIYISKMFHQTMRWLIISEYARNYPSPTRYMELLRRNRGVLQR